MDVGSSFSPSPQNRWIGRNPHQRKRPRMAKRFSFLVLIVPLLTGLACQQQHTASDYPQPNFNGPSLAPPPPAIAVAPAQPLPSLPQPKQTKQPPVDRTVDRTVPRSWIPLAAARPWKYI